MNWRETIIDSLLEDFYLQLTGRTDDQLIEMFVDNRMEEDNE